MAQPALSRSLQAVYHVRCLTHSLTAKRVARIPFHLAGILRAVLGR